MNFPCIQCGLCCRMLRDIPQLSEFNNGSGVCIHLNGNLCDIYNTRPHICNVEDVYNFAFAVEMSESEFIYENLKICYELNKLFENETNVKKLETILQTSELNCQTNGLKIVKPT